MTIRDPDLAIRGDQHVGRSVEMRLVVSGDRSLTQCHQNLALRAQFEHLVSPADLESLFPSLVSRRRTFRHP